MKPHGTEFCATITSLVLSAAGAYYEPVAGGLPAVRSYANPSLLIPMSLSKSFDEYMQDNEMRLVGLLRTESSPSMKHQVGAARVIRVRLERCGSLHAFSTGVHHASPMH